MLFVSAVLHARLSDIIYPLPSLSSWCWMPLKLVLFRWFLLVDMIARCVRLVCAFLIDCFTAFLRFSKALLIPHSSLAFLLRSSIAVHVVLEGVCFVLRLMI